MSQVNKMPVVVDSLFIVAPMACDGSVFGPCLIM